MGDCEFLDGCMFFNDQMENMPAVSDLLKEQYCRKDFSACARFQVAKALGRGNTPKDLFPTQGDRVQPLLDAG